MFGKSKKKEELKNIISNQNEVAENMKRIIAEQKDIIEFQKKQIDELNYKLSSLTVNNNCHHCMENYDIINALEQLVEKKEIKIMEGHKS